MMTDEAEYRALMCFVAGISISFLFKKEKKETISYRNVPLLRTSIGTLSTKY